MKRRRASVTSQLTSQYRRALSGAHRHLEQQAQERIAASGRAVLDQACGRLLTFIADAERRTARLGSPITTEEAEILRQAAAEIAQLRESATDAARAVARIVTA